MLQDNLYKLTYVMNFPVKVCAILVDLPVEFLTVEEILEGEDKRARRDILVGRSIYIQGKGGHNYVTQLRWSEFSWAICCHGARTQKEDEALRDVGWDGWVKFTGSVCREAVASAHENGLRRWQSSGRITEG